VKIAFSSTQSAVPWGGSEELWSRAASVLLGRGHEVYVSFPYRPEVPKQLAALRDQGGHLIANSQQARPPRRFGRWLFRRRHVDRQAAMIPWRECLQKVRPDVVLISMSWHIDDLSATQACRDLGIPYCLLIQAAGANTFLDSRYWGYYRTAYAAAATCFFVSEQNRDVMEANIGIDLSRSVIVDNPFAVKADCILDWPKSNKPWRLACVGRLHFQSKAQDLLIQTLRRPHWRDRPVEVTLFGDDCGNADQAKAMIELYGLEKQVKLGGFVDDITQVWREHHALVLPSRYEGNALAMIEAMLCGRVPIVTNVGRVARLVDDNVSGFVAAAATADLLDEALERAWHQRHDWRKIGAAAAATIRKRHSLKPVDDFADKVLQVATRPSTSVARAA
jgi:glycosyltransferase involved in cell wall biosynthesis